MTMMVLIQQSAHVIDVKYSKQFDNSLNSTQ